jgi:hypothetical protein
MSYLIGFVVEITFAHEDISEGESEPLTPTRAPAGT